MSVRERVRVETGARPYEVRIGEGLLPELAEALGSLAPSGRVVVVTDSNVDSLFGAPVRRSLEDAGLDATVITVEPGERSKSWPSAGQVLEEMAGSGLGRDGAVVAAGGGVVGDLAGFCAAVYMRGVPLVQFPTTLLAQVDSSVGGKTAVDLSAGKNLAGCFWQPSAVFADVGTLATLGDAQMRDGLAEAAKSAFLDGPDFTGWFEVSADAILARESAVMTDLVARCVRFKAAVVASDERESGSREQLNLGHTLAHAVEKLSGYSGVTHGEAVAAGLDFAAFAAERLGHCDHAWRCRQVRTLDVLGVRPAEVSFGPRELVAAMHSDKKVRDGAVRMVFSTAPGAYRVEPVDDDMLVRLLEEWRLSS